MFGWPTTRGTKLFEIEAQRVCLEKREENEEHDEERQEIENGAYGSEVNHEVAYVADIPPFRLFHVLGIDVVSSYGGLGKVIQQIIQQNLNWKHRQEIVAKRGRIREAPATLNMFQSWS